MKVEDKRVSDLISSVLRPDLNPQKEAVKRAKEGERLSDRVEISSRKTEVERILKRVREVPDVRTEKVERIMEALKRNEYEIDAEKVAKNILKEGILNEIL